MRRWQKPHGSHPELCQQQLKSVLLYNAETGEFSWTRNVRPRRFGVKAGYVSPNGYVNISIKGRQYLAHRLAWLYVHGSWPKNHIDHKNGDPGDNRIANLREATPQQNSANSRIASNNTSGIKGVVRIPRGKWVASIRVDGKTFRSRQFDNRHDAAKAYAKMAVRCFGEFARPDFGPATRPKRRRFAQRNFGKSVDYFGLY